MDNLSEVSILIIIGNPGLRRKLQSVHLNSVFSDYDFYDCRGDSNTCKYLKNYIGFKQDVEAEGLFITQVDDQQLNVCTNIEYFVVIYIDIRW
jgi:hypothetical protein